MIRIYLNNVSWKIDDVNRMFFNSETELLSYMETFKPRDLTEYSLGNGSSLDIVFINIDTSTISTSYFLKLNYLSILRFGVNYYYHITGYKINNDNLITYSCRLDYWNTYHINYLRNIGGSFKILRQHVNPWVKNSSKKTIDLIPNYDYDQPINNFDPEFIGLSKSPVKSSQLTTVKLLSGDSTVDNKFTSDGQATSNNTSLFAHTFSNIVDGVVNKDKTTTVITHEIDGVVKTEYIESNNATPSKFPLLDPPQDEWNVAYQYSHGLSYKKFQTGVSSKNYVYTVKDNDYKIGDKGYNIGIYNKPPTENPSLINRIGNLINPYVDKGGEPVNLIGVISNNFLGYVMDLNILNPDLLEFKITLYDTENVNFTDTTGAKSYLIPARTFKATIKVVEYYDSSTGEKRYTDLLFSYIDYSNSLKSLTLRLNKVYLSFTFYIKSIEFKDFEYETITPPTENINIDDWNKNSVAVFEEIKTININEDIYTPNYNKSNYLNGDYDPSYEPQIMLLGEEKNINYLDNKFNVPYNVYKDNFKILIKQFIGVNYAIDSIYINNPPSNLTNKQKAYNLITSLSVKYDNTLPSITDTFNSYLATSSAQFKNQFLTSAGNLNFQKQANKLNTISSVNNMIGSGINNGGNFSNAFNNPTGALNGLMDGANSFIDFQKTELSNERALFNGEQQIKQMQAQLIDLFNSPDTLNTGGDDIPANQHFNNIKNSLFGEDFEISLFINVGQVNKNKLIEISQYLHLNGYIINKYKTIEKGSFNTLLTRTEFNFIQIEKLSDGISGVDLSPIVINHFDRIFNKGVRLYNKAENFKRPFKNNNPPVELVGKNE